MKVPLLDLKPQYKALKNEIDAAVNRVIESQYFILGPEVTEMENELASYLKCNYAVGVSSGTDALLIALMAIDIKPGDEVILPTFSFFATAGVVSRLNAVPVFADIDPVTFNIDPNDIERRITSKTKAIIPVHLYGQCADMSRIMKIAGDHNLKVIEDAAQAIGAQYKDGNAAGTIGDIGCYSFFPSKNLGCFGDGGLVATNNSDLHEKLKMLRVHGMEPKYYHKIIGGNFRLDALQAAVIRVKLPHLDQWSEKRRGNAELYTKLLIDAGLAQETGRTDFDELNKVLIPKAIYKPNPLVPNRSETNNSEPNIPMSDTTKMTNDLFNYHIFNQFIIRVKQRDPLRKFLAENEIMTDIYYPLSFHQQECFADLGYSSGGFPNADFVAQSSIALPIYPELSPEQIYYVAEKIRAFIK